MDNSLPLTTNEKAEANSTPSRPISRHSTAESSSAGTSAQEKQEGVLFASVTAAPTQTNTPPRRASSSLRRNLLQTPPRSASFDVSASPSSDTATRRISFPALEQQQQPPLTQPPQMEPSRDVSTPRKLSFSSALAASSSAAAASPSPNPPSNPSLNPKPPAKHISFLPMPDEKHYDPSEDPIHAARIAAAERGELPLTMAQRLTRDQPYPKTLRGRFRAWLEWAALLISRDPCAPFKPRRIKSLPELDEPFLAHEFTLRFITYTAYVVPGASPLLGLNPLLLNPTPESSPISVFAHRLLPDLSKANPWHWTLFRSRHAGSPHSPPVSLTPLRAASSSDPDHDPNAVFSNAPPAIFAEDFDPSQPTAFASSSSTTNTRNNNQTVATTSRNHPNPNGENSRRSPHPALQTLTSPNTSTLPAGNSPTPSRGTSSSPNRRRFPLIRGSIIMHVNHNDNARFFLQVVYVLLCCVAILIALAFDGYTVNTYAGITPQPLTCNAQLWSGTGMSGAIGCGVDGLECRPLRASPDAWFGFRCGALCVSDQSQYASKVVRGGTDGIYTADSNICAAAVHAGIITDQTGGCFEVNLVGSQSNFTGYSANGINSQHYGWFARSMRFRALPGYEKYCSRTTWATHMTIAFVVFFLAVIIRIRNDALFLLLGQMGVFFIGISKAQLPSGNDFLAAVNNLTSAEYIILPISYIFWAAFGIPRILPDPRRVPFEVFCLWFAPYWVFVNLDDLVLLGFDFTFTSSGATTTTKNLSVYIIIAVVGIPTIIVQLYLYYRANILPQTLALGVGVFGVYLFILGVVGHAYLSIHFHHYFFGLAIISLCRGHTPWGIILTAIGYGLFVNGVVEFGASPLYEQDSSSTGYSTIRLPSEPQLSPIWTSVNVVGDSVTLGWEMPGDLYTHWNCGNTTGALLPSFAEYEALLDHNVTWASKHANDGPQTLDDGSLPPDLTLDTTASYDFRYAVQRNGVLAGLGYLETSLIHNDFISETKIVPVVFTVASYMGNGQTGSESLQLPLPFPDNALQSWALQALKLQVSRGEVQYGGYYNSTEALDPCKRMQAIYSRLNMLKYVVENAPYFNTPRPEWWWLSATGFVGY